MTTPIDIDAHVAAWAGADHKRKQVAATVSIIAKGCQEIGDLVSWGDLEAPPPLGTMRKRGGEHDELMEIDVVTGERLLSVVRKAPVAAVATSDLAEPIEFDAGNPLLLAFDPIDGSNNFDTNLPMGTVFSILPAKPGAKGAQAFLQPGKNQIAAGFVVYGPRTVLALTLGAGTSLFTFDRRSQRFLLSHPEVAIPEETREYAINASNWRHWENSVRTYVEDCMLGSIGPREADYNMRWTGSVAAGIVRIMAGGGVYLYPADKRKGHSMGRLKLVCEANAMAFIVEQAKGRASTGLGRILDVVPGELHQRTPFIVGSRLEVEYIDRIYRDPHATGLRSPLFKQRGLFRS